MDIGHTKTVTSLVDRRVKTIPTVDDDNHFLKFATMCFILALLCKARVITQSSGDVMRDLFGDVRHEYQKSNPLFFFAQGSSKPFKALLPYETFRMYAYEFVNGYVLRAFYERTGSYMPAPKIFSDNTKGGFNWDDQHNDDFDTVEEDIESQYYLPEDGISDDEDDIEDYYSDL